MRWIISAAVVAVSLNVAAPVAAKSENRSTTQDFGLGLVYRSDAKRLGRLPEPASDDDFPARDANKEELGRLLFFDKILSGNENISCATCHHPMAGTGDGLSLPVGAGAAGLGVTRDLGEGDLRVTERVPRNAPHLFNLGAAEFTVMFHDGRVAVDADEPGGFLSPAGEQLPLGLDNVLAAQAMFPVTSFAEMAGPPGSNAIADASAEDRLAGADGVWDLIAQRLQGIPEYVDLFSAAFDDVSAAGDIEYRHVANAIAAFEAAAWRADDSRFDRFLNGDRFALSVGELRGMDLFYGKAGCADCHSGTFQTDHSFASVAMVQVGPGKGDTFGNAEDGLQDFGFERVTGDAMDRYRFRVPSLRNVSLTAPYGHAGAYDDLEAVVRHHLDPAEGWASYDRTQVVMPLSEEFDDFGVLDDPASVDAIIASAEVAAQNLSDIEVTRLLDFLYALTGRQSMDLRRDVPSSVPSGLPVFD